MDFIQTEAADAFIDGVRDREIKQHFLVGDDRSLNESLKVAESTQRVVLTTRPH
jgi:hypothetical protein